MSDGDKANLYETWLTAAGDWRNNASGYMLQPLNEYEPEDLFYMQWCIQQEIIMREQNTKK